MAFQKKTWKDRLSEFPGRRLLNIISNSDGQMVVDVARHEGEVPQDGDAFNQANMNDLEQRIGDGFDDVVSDIYVGNDGKLHKVKGSADTVLPFNSIKNIRVVAQNSGSRIQPGYGGLDVSIVVPQNITTGILSVGAKVGSSGVTISGNGIKKSTAMYSNVVGIFGGAGTYVYLLETTPGGTIRCTIGIQDKDAYYIALSMVLLAF